MMKLQELFEPKASKGKVDQEDSDQFVISRKIGKREITFQARREGGRSQKKWEIWFTEADETGKSSWEKTGSGNEVEVFSFVLNATREFIQKYQPNQLTFTADKSEGDTRANLYRKLVNKFGTDYMSQDFEVGMGS